MDLLLRRRMMMQKGGGGHNLPSEYQEVEWIMPNGQQYIIINFPPTVENEFFGIRWESIESSYNRLTYGDNNDNFFGTRYDNTFITTWISGKPTGGGIPVNPGVKTIYGVNTEGIYGGEFYLELKRPLLSSISSLHIFSKGDGSTRSMNIKLFSLTVISADSSVVQLIPCYKKSNNVAGMYDLINDVFYTNEGPGEFTVGPDVN